MKAEKFIVIKTVKINEDNHQIRRYKSCYKRRSPLFKIDFPKEENYPKNNKSTKKEKFIVINSESINVNKIKNFSCLNNKSKIFKTKGNYII